jgi:hypothetical protein
MGSQLVPATKGVGRREVRQSLSNCALWASGNCYVNVPVHAFPEGVGSQFPGMCEESEISEISPGFARGRTESVRSVAKLSTNDRSMRRSNPLVDCCNDYVLSGRCEKIDF